MDFLYDAELHGLFHLWITIMLAAALLCFVAGETTRNYSQVDKLWSLMPVIYSWITVFYSPSPRLIFMASLVTIWGLRLSYNFYRKGGYHLIPWKGTEDYRWQVLRNHPLLRGRLRFGLFNLFFISIYQHLLILLISFPLLFAAVYPEKAVAILDLVAGALMLGFIITETIADNQQFQFQREKRAGRTDGNRFQESLRKGFIMEGLWSYARHPNFASEQGIWISFYFFGVAASGQWINVTITGPLLLVLLFAGSTRFTESISSRKYPGYALYQKEVPKFIPIRMRYRSART